MRSKDETGTYADTNTSDPIQDHTAWTTHEKHSENKNNRNKKIKDHYPQKKQQPMTTWQ